MCIFAARVLIVAAVGSMVGGRSAFFTAAAAFGLWGHVHMTSALRGREEAAKF